MHSDRWTHLIYSSFQSAAGGGWQIGDDTGAGDRDRELAREHAVTTLVPREPVDEFISTREVEALPRRCDYHVLAEQCVFVHALPAGRDSTRRPGNVFSHVVIDHAPDSPTQSYPIQWYRSRDLLEPFGARAVNEATLPAGVGEPAASEIGDIFAAWMLVRNMGEDRVGAIYQLQNLLTTGSQTAILLAASTDEAATWIAALSSTLSRRTAVHHLQFSTFTRAQELVERRDPTRPAVLAVPDYDRESIPAQFRLRVVNPADPTTWGEPSSPWAAATAAALARGVEETDLAEVLADQVWWEARPSGSLAPEEHLLRQIDAPRSDLLAAFQLADQALPAEQDSPRLVERLVSHPRLSPTGTGAASEVRFLLAAPWRPAHPALRQLWGRLRRREAAAEWMERMTDPQLFREANYWSSREPVSDLRNFTQLEPQLQWRLTGRITGEAELIAALRNSWALYLHPGLSERDPVLNLIERFTEQLPLTAAAKQERLEHIGQHLTNHGWFKQNYLQPTVLRDRLAADLPRTEYLRHLAAGSGLLPPPEKERF